ncbi:uncharacterized protein [Bemisia tabaci]|uniref:uncharacterized protein isoform X3 n=1 Tax=Bemisia tabaci TaxID=7038 RepID=UPI003B27D959
MHASEPIKFLNLAIYAQGPFTGGKQFSGKIVEWRLIIQASQWMWVQTFLGFTVASALRKKSLPRILVS